MLFLSYYRNLRTGQMCMNTWANFSGRGHDAIAFIARCTVSLQPGGRMCPSVMPLQTGKKMRRVIVRCTEAGHLRGRTRIFIVFVATVGFITGVRRPGRDQQQIYESTRRPALGSFSKFVVRSVRIGDSYSLSQKASMTRIIGPSHPMLAIYSVGDW